MISVPFSRRTPRPNRVESWVQAAFDQQPQLLRARMELQVARGP